MCYGKMKSFFWLRITEVGSTSSVIVVEDVSANKEVMHLISRVGDTLTVLRAQEGTTAVAFAIGSRVELRITEGFLQNFIDGGYY